MLNITNVNAIYGLKQFKYTKPTTANGKKKVNKFYNFSRPKAKQIITILNGVDSMSRTKLLETIGAGLTTVNTALRHLLDKKIIVKTENLRKSKREVVYKLTKKVK